SSDFAALLLQKAGIVATPGNGFGQEGEGYIRFALTVSSERIKEALERMKKLAL
ncbi:MAG TPA: LL-diaminopimelate aminotransferase, partial [Rhodospirillaceae bacterium]|nr:LL-diaminopimelate aminotransferase [Rhodospirillaceae bacterium]